MSTVIRAGLGFSFWHGVCSGSVCLPARGTTGAGFYMIQKVIELLFRCSHKKITLPITPVGKPGSAEGKPYVVCLDCGGQFAYNWKEMRMGERIDVRPKSSQAESRNWLARLLRRCEQAVGQGRKS